LWRQAINPPSTRHSPRATLHGLRIALVDADARTCLVARQMVQAQRDGWTLEVYYPSCLVQDLSRLWHALWGSVVKAELVSRLPPDVVLMDLFPISRITNSSCQSVATADVASQGTLPGLSGIDCTRRLKAHLLELPVLMLSARLDEETIVRSLMAGGSGFLVKPVAPDQLMRAVTRAAKGLPALCLEAQTAVLGLLHRMGRASGSAGLSHREQDAMLGLAQDLSDKEIAALLGMGSGTVHSHLSSIYRKLRVHSRSEARRKFVRSYEAGIKR
jgi:DNA-binding NarL/FixJ family response regulator